VTLCEDEEADDIIELESDEDDDGWEYGDEDNDEANTALYDSPLDQLDEILNLGSHLQHLQQVDVEFYKYLL
jgi:hypothetical protein